MDVVAVLLAEQTARHQKGLCVYCGVPLGVCWCGENEPPTFEPAADGPDEGGAE